VTTNVAVKIRLKRLGKIRAPYYRIVIADSRTKRDGRAIEEIGKYHPTEEPSLIEINSERALYWLGVGAQPSEQVMALLKITGDWQKHKNLPGQEGTLRVAGPKADRKALFEAASKEGDFGAEPKDGATTPKASKKAAKSASADSTDAPAGTEATPDSADAAAPAAEAPVEAPAAVDAPAEAPAAADASTDDQAEA
jgi:small subunit ribosomal protein S16